LRQSPENRDHQILPSANGAVQREGKMFVGCALSCVRNMARAFSPRFLFRFDTWGNAQRVSPGWYEAAPLALTKRGAMNETQ